MPNKKNIKIAVYCDANPLNDFIDILSIPEEVSVELAINEINKVLIGYHIEFVSYEDAYKKQAKHLKSVTKNNKK